MKPYRVIVEVAALIGLASCAETGSDGPAVAARACAASQASTWQQPISSIPRSLARDPAGGLVVLDGDGPSVLTRYSDVGASIWTAMVEGRPGAVFVVPGGDTLAAGGVVGTQPVDPQIRWSGTPRVQSNVIRLDPRGQTLWQSKISDDSGDLFPTFVSAGLDGDVVVGGAYLPDLSPSNFPNPPFIDGGFLARLSSSGQQLWERHFVNPGAVRGFVQDLRGRTGVIFWLDRPEVIDGLMLQPKEQGFAGFLVWFDAAGRTTEAFDITEASGPRYSGVVRDDQGRLYTTGYITHDGSSYTSEFFVGAFGPTGDRLWTHHSSLGSQVDDSTLAIDECGDVLMVGNGSQGTSSGILAVRMSPQGVVKSQIVVPASLANYVAGMAPAPGGVFLTGARDNHQTRVLFRLGL